MTDLTDLTLAEARDALQREGLSAVELTQAHLDAMERRAALNAFITETPEQALGHGARRPTRASRAGEAGPLEGMPLGIKDLYCTEGRADARPAATSSTASCRPTNSTVTAKLWRDGAVMLGKLNLDEFAMGSSNETSYSARSSSPWRRKAAARDAATCVPGGSSGGSAAAVAARLCLGATATDTGGSIRQPAAFTGTVGIKPTYGRCSRWGIVAFASSLDQAGPDRPHGARRRDPAALDGRATTRRTRPRVDVAGARLRGRGRPLGEGHDDRHPEGIPPRRHAGRDRGAVEQGIAWLQGGRRRDRRHLAAAHAIRAAGLLHRGAGRGLVATSRATTACATACACRARDIAEHVRATPAPPASARRCAAAS